MSRLGGGDEAIWGGLRGSATPKVATPSGACTELAEVSGSQ